MRKRYIAAVACLLFLCISCGGLIYKKMPKQKVTDGLLMSIESIDQYDKLVEVKLNFKQSSSDSFQEVYIPQDTKLIYNGEEINCLSKSYRSELSDDKKTLDIYITCSLSEHLAFDEIQLSISKLISCSEMKKYSLKEYQGNWSATAHVNKIDSENFAFDYISEEKQVELCGKTIQVESVECGNNVVMLICEKVVSEKESPVDYTSNILDESGTKTGVYVTVVYDDNSKENLECSLDAENNIIALAPEGLTKREITEVQIGDLRFAKR